MRLAICAPFMEADLWQQRLAGVLQGERMQFDEYYSADALQAAPSLFSYQSLWVTLPGAQGMEAVISARERSASLPIVWITDDEQFGLIGFNLQITAFLRSDSSDNELTAALQRCEERLGDLR